MRPGTSACPYPSPQRQFLRLVSQHEADRAQQGIVLGVLANGYARAQGRSDIAADRTGDGNPTPQKPAIGRPFSIVHVQPPRVDIV